MPPPRGHLSTTQTCVPAISTASTAVAKSLVSSCTSLKDRTYTKAEAMSRPRIRHFRPPRLVGTRLFPPSFCPYSLYSPPRFWSQHRRDAGADGDASGADGRHRSRAADPGGRGRGAAARPRQRHVVLAALAPDGGQTRPDEPNRPHRRHRGGQSGAPSARGQTELGVERIHARLQGKKKKKKKGNVKKIHKRGWNRKTGMAHIAESGQLFIFHFHIWQAERNPGRIRCSMGNAQI